jgi:hypothetical protein
MAKRQTKLSTLKVVDDSLIAELLKQLADAIKQSSSNIAEPFVQDCYKAQTDATDNQDTYWSSDEAKKVTITVKNNSKHCKMEVSIGEGQVSTDFTLKPGQHKSYSRKDATSLEISCWGAESDKAGHHQCSGEYKIVFN